MNADCILSHSGVFILKTTHTHTQLFLNTCFYIITGKYEITYCKENITVILIYMNVIRYRFVFVFKV